MIPTQFSYATVLSSCTKLSSLSHGRQIHAHMIKHEIVNNVVLVSSSIDMYSKCRDVNDARLVLDTMPKKNIITWNEKIHGHSRLIDYVIKIFNSMFQEHGIEPLLDHYTFVIDSLGRDDRFDEV
ncbi:hypothetical protein L2E82_38887 [Cichorium intybus]|uniref:Uncharacterized protein n=1 Tax=Cichorium intybus TaxID=13427 RepID=A0ACB9AID9_CICIN|nr:hypothetical protein L2E82_38887 [Cichorium intybus]